MLSTKRFRRFYEKEKNYIFVAQDEKKTIRFYNSLWGIIIYILKVLLEQF